MLWHDNTRACPLAVLGRGGLTPLTLVVCLCWLCWLQSIEHLRWDERKLDRVFNFTHLQPSSATWLGQEQVQEIQHNLDVR